MDFCLKDVFSVSFSEKESWDRGMARFYGHFAQDFVYPNPKMIMNFLDNHDIDRYSTAVKRDVRKYKMGLALLLTVRGYPQIYYGTEILLDGISGDYHGWATDKRNAFTAEGRTVDENEVFNYTRTLLNFRKNNPVLQNGMMKQFIPQNGIYVFFRYNNEKIVMIIANNNLENKELQLSRFDEMLSGKNVGVEITSGKQILLNNPITIPTKTVYVIEIN